MVSVKIIMDKYVYPAKNTQSFFLAMLIPKIANFRCPVTDVLLCSLQSISSFTFTRVSSLFEYKNVWLSTGMARRKHAHMTPAFPSQEGPLLMNLFCEHLEMSAIYFVLADIVPINKLIRYVLLHYYLPFLYYFI